MVVDGILMQDHERRAELWSPGRTSDAMQSDRWFLVVLRRSNRTCLLVCDRNLCDREDTSEGQAAQYDGVDTLVRDPHILKSAHEPAADTEQHMPTCRI